MKAPGKVWLVGAGPGDPELLTLKAVRALGRADVVLADDLVSDAVLAFAPQGARVVHVGKRGGCKSTPQDFIERLMVSDARAAATVRPATRILRLAPALTKRPTPARSHPRRGSTARGAPQRPPAGPRAW